MDKCGKNLEYCGLINEVLCGVVKHGHSRVIKQKERIFYGTDIDFGRLKFLFCHIGR